MGNQLRPARALEVVQLVRLEALAALAPEVNIPLNANVPNFSWPISTIGSKPQCPGCRTHTMPTVVPLVIEIISLRHRWSRCSIFMQYHRMCANMDVITGSAGFGANNNNNTTSLFGQSKPAFGATPTTGGGGLFGSSTAATSGTPGGFGGGFGSTNTNNNTTGGGLFGSQPKPAFGGNAGGGGLFGGGNTSGFGSTTNQPTNAFGASSALSQNNAVCEGTGSTPFTVVPEKDGNMNNHYQSISFMAPYKNFSLEVKITFWVLDGNC